MSRSALACSQFIFNVDDSSERLLSVALYVTWEDDANGYFHCYNEEKGTEPVACVSPPLFPIVTHHLMKSFSHHLQYSSLIFSVLPGKTTAGVKYKGTVEVPNLSDENDMEDLDVSIRQQTYL